MRLHGFWLLLASPFCAHALTVMDDAGMSVRLDAPARRIISLTPHATELLAHLGAERRLVGRDLASDYPTSVRALPVVGQYGSFNVEAIVALRPDLVVAWEGPQAGGALAKLRSLGIPVFTSQPARIEQLPGTMRALGRLIGQDDEAERLASQFAATWHALVNRYATRRPLRVVPQVGNTPPMTVNDAQFTASLLRACNTTNPFGKLSQPVPLISPEAMMEAQPDAVVAMTTEQDAPNWQVRWRSIMPKVAWLVVDPLTLGRPGPRILAATEALCRRLDALRTDAYR